jgi:hypothetical protein
MRILIAEAAAVLIVLGVLVAWAIRYVRSRRRA